MSEEPVPRGRLFVTSPRPEAAAAVAVELAHGLPRCGRSGVAGGRHGRERPRPDDDVGLEGVRHRLLRWSARGRRGVPARGASMPCARRGHGRTPRGLPRPRRARPFTSSSSSTTHASRRRLGGPVARRRRACPGTWPTRSLHISRKRRSEPSSRTRRRVGRLTPRRPGFARGVLAPCACRTRTPRGSTAAARTPRRGGVAAEDRVHARRMRGRPCRWSSGHRWGCCPR